MYKVKLSKTELKKLNESIKTEKDKRVYLRLQCIYLNNSGEDNKEIAGILGVCVDTVTDWIKLYTEEGLAGLTQLDFKGKRKSKIDDYVEKIKQDVKDNTISSIAELQDFIKDKYSIELECSWLFRCCKKKLICLSKRPA